MIDFLGLSVVVDRLGPRPDSDADAILANKNQP
jgi:hypothetical protein